jgi:hypothetical protein
VRDSLAEQLVHGGVGIDRALGDARDRVLDAVLAKTVAKTSHQRIAQQLLDLRAGRRAPALVALAALGGPGAMLAIAATS